MFCTSCITDWCTLAVLQAEQVGEDEKKGREDATQAVVKLNNVIQSVQAEMGEARAAADRRVTHHHRARDILFKEHTLYEVKPAGQPYHSSSQANA